MSLRKELLAEAEKRILILDGAMGTMLQKLKLNEAEYRGGRFLEHKVDILGMNDALCLTKPNVVKNVHKKYLEAGADIIKTCSFSANAVSLAEYGLSAYAREISAASARIAREAIAEFETQKPGKRHYVAGVLGGTSKSAAIPPDTDDLSRRSIFWDELVSAYYENALGLLEGGIDLFLIETIYDTLNAKAAIFAVVKALEEKSFGDDAPPIMLSAAIAGAGRLLAGQSPAAFAVSTAHAAPLSLGLNCSLGALSLLPALAELAASTDALISFHPNAGLPLPDGGYEETPETMSSALREAALSGLVNLASGCCGSTPEHIKAISESLRGIAPRRLKK